jgi:hypothetical protein
MPHNSLKLIPVPYVADVSVDITREFPQRSREYAAVVFSLVHTPSAPDRKYFQLTRIRGEDLYHTYYIDFEAVPGSMLGLVDAQELGIRRNELLAILEAQAAILKAML